MSHGVLCLVRPGNDETGEGQEEGYDHQDKAYRKAWELFNPGQEEEEERQDKISNHEADMEDHVEEGQRSGALNTPKAPTAK